MSKKIVYPKLPKPFKDKWLEALRSGKYEQTKSELESYQGRFCCLGVACRIMHPKKNIMGNPFIVSKLKVNVPKILKGNSDKNLVVSKLTEMNDGINTKHKSFKQIANWIEKNL